MTVGELIDKLCYFDKGLKVFTYNSFLNETEEISEPVYAEVDDWGIFPCFDSPNKTSVVIK